MSTTKKSATPIQMRAGKKLFIQKFGGRSIINALIELIKNALDWKASNIWVNVNSDFIEVIDDGQGMTAENRNSFCSAAMSTSNADRQSGKFGTGSKSMLYISNGVSVTTRTKEGPEVIGFNLRTEEYQTQLFRGEDLMPEILPSSSWNMESPTGTFLRYDFKGKSASQLKNPESIAVELSQELPYAIRNAILFNGKELPEKKIKGKPILEEFYVEGLGQVSLELYSLEGGSKNNDGIYLSSTKMPEVRFTNFLKMLPIAKRTLVPELYLNLADISGTITCPGLFKPHINDDRQSFAATIADSELIGPFIMLLRKKEAEIKAILGLQEKESNETVGNLIDSLMKLSEKAYGPEYKLGDRDTSVNPDATNQNASISIHGTKREYQVGDVVELTAKINREFCTAKNSDIVWHTARSGLTNIHISQDQTVLTGTATNVGWQSISVNANEAMTQTTYEIVKEKRIYLSATRGPMIQIGQEYKITCYNVDLAKDKINWKVIGPAKIQPLGVDRKQGSLLVVGTDCGEAFISAEATYKNGDKFSSVCVIPIEDPLLQLFKIKNYKFIIERGSYDGHRAIRMEPGVGDPEKAEHSLYVNEGAKIWSQKGAGNSMPLLIWIIAQEFARFWHQDVHEEKSEMDNSVLTKYERFAEGVVEELLSKV